MERQGKRTDNSQIYTEIIYIKYKEHERGVSKINLSAMDTKNFVNLSDKKITSETALFIENF
jgi:hypothetical protein